MNPHLSQAHHLSPWGLKDCVEDKQVLALGWPCDIVGKENAGSGKIRGKMRGA